MDRSSGFGSTPCDWTPYSDSLSLRLPYPVKLATECKSLTHYAKGTQSLQLEAPSRALQPVATLRHAQCRSLAASFRRPSIAGKDLISCRSVSWRGAVCVAKNRRRLKLELLLFVCMRFQDLFHSPSGVLLTFPSQYWFTIGRSRVFSLGGWSPHVQTGFHVSRPTCRALSSTVDLSRTGLSPTMAVLSRTFR